MPPSQSVKRAELTSRLPDDSMEPGPRSLPRKEVGECRTFCRASFATALEQAVAGTSPEARSNIKSPSAVRSNGDNCKSKQQVAQHTVVLAANIEQASLGIDGQGRTQWRPIKLNHSTEINSYRPTRAMHLTVRTSRAINTNSSFASSEKSRLTCATSMHPMRIIQYYGTFFALRERVFGSQQEQTLNGNTPNSKVNPSAVAAYAVGRKNRGFRRYWCGA